MTEFVWVMDSTQACSKPPCDACNPTNDIVVEPQLSVSRMLISSIEVATVEFPRVQRLIEHCWSRLYFFHNFPIFKNQGQTFLVILHKKCESIELWATLPLVLNAIHSLRVSPRDARQFLLRTKRPHGLTPENNDTAQLLGQEAPILGPFEVLSDCEFAVVSSTPIRLSAALQLYIPPLANPLEIARQINIQLNSGGLFCGPVVELDYRRELSRFVLTLCSDRYESATLVVDQRSLDLGFARGRHTLQPQCPLVASLTPFGTTFVTLSSGNYTIGEMLQEITSRFNACFFATNTNLLTVAKPGAALTINIPPGSYTPVSLSITLSQLLAPMGVRVRFLFETGQYLFVSDELFSLEFQAPTLSTVAPKLGFRTTRYGGYCMYRSDDPISAQMIVPALYFNVLVCDAMLNPDETTLSLYFSPPVPAANATLERQIVPHASSVLVTTAQQAVGAQRHAVVELGFPNGQRIRCVVKNVLSGTQFLVKIDPDVTLPANQCTVELLDTPSMSLFTSLNNAEIVKPEILGFGTCDLLWGGPGSHLSGPYAFRMVPFTYVLLEMLTPEGSARIEHRFQSDHKTTILAKLLLNYEPILERFFPMRATFFTGTRVTKFHFRLLNPDHTLYLLHGQPWRATFRLVAEQNPQSLITGNYITPAPDIGNPRRIPEAPFATAE